MGRAKPLEQKGDAPTVRPKVFRRRPGKHIVDAFLKFNEETGRPQEWKWLTWDKPPSDAKPVILKQFYLPLSAKRDRANWVPCILCCPASPKFTWGYLSWYAHDGLMRLIGHDCTRPYFDEGAFDAAVKEYEAEESEAAARKYLEAHIRRLPRLMMSAWDIGDRCESTGIFLESVRKALTIKACREISSAMSSRGALYVTAEVSRITENGPRLVQEDQRVAVVAAAGVLSDRTPWGGEVRLSRAAVGPLCISSEDAAREVIRGISRSEVIAAEMAIRRLDEILKKAVLFLRNANVCFQPANMAKLDKWARDRASPVQWRVSLSDVGKLTVVHGSGARHSVYLPAMLRERCDPHALT